VTAVLVDTSSFIAFLRGNDREAVPALILAGKVILSSVVKLELLAGVRRHEAGQLRELLSGLALLDDFPPPAICESLLARARGRGLLGGLPDLMILADCYRSGARLMTSDTKLKALARELEFKIHEMD
jgi:predicted nucleic acid-binding protein